MSDAAFTQQDQDDFARLQGLLDQEFREQAEHAGSIYSKGLYIKEVRDRGLHRIAGLAFGAWTDQRYGIGERQAGKYTNIVENLTRERVRAWGLDLEANNEMALSPAWLWDTLLKLLKEGLDAADVGRGRVAGDRLRRGGAAIEAACAEAERVARQEARQHPGGQGSKRDRSLAGLLQRLNGDLEVIVKRLGQVQERIDKGDKVPGELGKTQELLGTVHERAVPILKVAVPGPENVGGPGPEEAVADPPRPRPAPQGGAPPEQDRRAEASAVRTEEAADLAPLYSAFQKAEGMHERIWQVLYAVAVQPDSPDHEVALRRLGRELARRAEVPGQLYQQWTERLLKEGGAVVVETLRQAGLPGYRQALEQLLKASLSVPLRRHIREVLTVAS